MPIFAVAAFRRSAEEVIPMMRKMLHLAYHFVTVADEIPRHVTETR